MKRITRTALLIMVLYLCCTAALAESFKFQYKLSPGQTWVATSSTQSEMTFMGTKDVQQSKNIIEYRISKGLKQGWITITACITGGDTGGGQMDLSQLRFIADMHSSGEIRNIRYEGRSMPSFGSEAEELPPEMAAMFEQSSKMMAEAWKNAVFWFPELPEYALELGDEFEVTQKMGIGDETVGMQMQSISKQVFTLEDVSEDLAYFSVKERSVTKSEGMMGGGADTKTAGKGEAIFDLKVGMWIDFVTKSRSQVQFEGVPGMDEGSQDVYYTTKIRMEKK